MFLPYSYDHTKPDAFEYLPAAAGSVEVGMALAFSGGKLQKVSGTTKPEYLCMADLTAEAGETIPVIRVSDDTIYETELSADSASIALGTKYTIDATGTMITATSASGVAEVVAFDGKTAGAKVRVRF